MEMTRWGGQRRPPRSFHLRGGPHHVEGTRQGRRAELFRSARARRGRPSPRGRVARPEGGRQEARTDASGPVVSGGDTAGGGATKPLDLDTDKKPGRKSPPLRDGTTDDLIPSLPCVSMEAFRVPARCRKVDRNGEFNPRHARVGRLAPSLRVHPDAPDGDAAALLGFSPFCGRDGHVEFDGLVTIALNRRPVLLGVLARLRYPCNYLLDGLADEFIQIYTITHLSLVMPCQTPSSGSH
jgi:hypothetical protein